MYLDIRLKYTSYFNEYVHICTNRQSKKNENSSVNLKRKRAYNHKS